MKDWTSASAYDVKSSPLSVSAAADEPWIMIACSACSNARAAAAAPVESAPFSPTSRICSVREWGPSRHFESSPLPFATATHVLWIHVATSAPAAPVSRTAARIFSS